MYRCFQVTNTESLAKKLTLLLLFLSLFINAQSKFGTIFFKDGSHEMGFISVTKSNTILFKKEFHDKPTEYGFEQVTGFNDNDEYKYVLFDEEPIILQVVIEGKINLYLDTFITFSPGNWSNGIYYSGGGYAIKYYIEHENGITVSSDRLRKKNDYIFSNCPLVSENIEKKKLKRRKLVEIIEFYNKNCD